MELLRCLTESNQTEIIAKFKDDFGNIYKIGLGIESLNKTDKELEELATAKYNEIKYREANPPKPTYVELRQKEYIAKGVTEDKMIVALWEKVVENRNQSANDLQTIREQIKTKFPKLS